MEELSTNVEKYGGVAHYIDYLFPDIESVKDRAGELAQRVSWEVSAAEEDLRGGGVELSDFLPAAGRFLSRGSENLKNYHNSVLQLEAERLDRIAKLNELKSRIQEYIHADYEERRMRAASELQAASAAFESACAERNGAKCIETFETLKYTADKVQAVGDPQLGEFAHQIRETSGEKARKAFEEDLREALKEEGYPLQAPDHSAIRNLQRIQSSMAFLDAWQGATGSLPLSSPNESTILKAREWQNSWSLNALLRDGIARYRYHFSTSTSAVNHANHPEWAADFLSARIEEFSPFLDHVRQGAGIVYANALLSEFVSKVVSDAQSIDNAETLEHAASVTLALELRLQTNLRGMISPLPLLMEDEWFMTNWAASEMSRAEKKIGEVLEGLLHGDWQYEEAQSIITHLRDVEQTIQLMDQSATRNKAFRLISLPILQSLRSTLRSAATGDENSSFDVRDLSDDQFRLCCRAASVSANTADSLREMQDTSVFYMMLEEDERELGAVEPVVFRKDIRRFEQGTSDLVSTIVRCTVDRFRSDIVPYRNYVLYAELPSPDPDTVVAHDLSGELIPAMEVLERRLGILLKATGKSRTGAAIWKTIASELDKFMFEDVFLMAFVGGDKGTIEVATQANEYLSARARARMLRQMCHDAGVLVNLFKVFTSKFSKLFRRLSEAITLIILSVSASAEWEKNEERRNVLNALEEMPTRADEARVQEVATLLQHALHVSALSPREAKEMLIISGTLLPPLS